jgi:hypothetical protein
VGRFSVDRDGQNQSLFDDKDNQKMVLSRQVFVVHKIHWDTSSSVIC